MLQNINQLPFFHRALYFFIALIAVFIVGLFIGFIIGLIVGNTAIGEYLEDILSTYQAMLDDAYYE